RRARRLIGAIVKADCRPRAALDHDLVAVMHQLAHAAGHQPDPVFMGLHLFWNADQHASTSPGGIACDTCRYQILRQFPRLVAASGRAYRQRFSKRSLVGYARFLTDHGIWERWKRRSSLRLSILRSE